VLALGLSRLGRLEEARATAGPLIDGQLEYRWLSGLVFRLELAVLWQERAAAEVLANLLEPVVRLAIVDGCTAPVARLVGNARLLLGDIESARSCYVLAIERCQRVRYRPELALSRLDLAELLLEHFHEEWDVAMEHLQRAASEFETLRMLRPSIGRGVDSNRRIPDQRRGVRSPTLCD
jgi:hypothetical protein